MLGFAGHRDARETILGDHVDVLLTVGAALNETTTFNWDPRLRPTGALMQIDVDADRIGRNYPIDVALVGDAQTILTELVYHLHRLIRDGEHPRSRWPEEPPLVRGDARHLDPELRRSTARPVAPQRWRCDLEEALPPDAVIFSDIGSHMLFNLHHLTIRRGQRFVLNLGMGSMGHGTVAPLGAALAQERPVFAIIGDGCFTMNGMELLTAAEHQIRVIWLVENNNMHGITWHGSRSLGRPLDAVRFRQRLEVAAIARAMGLPAWVVDRPGELPGVVREAMAQRGPAVIEIRVDGEIPPPLFDRVRSIAGFLER